MSLIRKHGAVLQAWACLALVLCCFTEVTAYDWEGDMAGLLPWIRQCFTWTLLMFWPAAQAGPL